MATTRAKTPADRKSDAELYDGIVARSNARIMAASRATRDIAPCPETQDRGRRDAAAASLRVFMEVYFRGTFCLAWSDDHLQVIERLQEVVSDGGLFALAMPRGHGKSSL